MICFLTFSAVCSLSILKKNIYLWWYAPSLAPPHFTWVLPCLAWAWKLFHVFILGTWLLLSLLPTPKPKPVPPRICRAGKALPVLAKWNVWSWSRKAKGTAWSLSTGGGYQCFEQGSLPLWEPNSFPELFSVAAGAPQVKDPRTFLPVCVRDTEGQAGLSQGQLCLLSLKVISSGLFFVMHI